MDLRKSSTAKRRVTSIKAILIAIVFGLSTLIYGCSSDNDMYPSYEPKWASEPVRVELLPYNNFKRFGPDLQFSRDSKYICVWWWPSHKRGDYNKEQGKFVVFDLSGKEIQNAKTPEGHLQGDFVKLFPQVAWRSKFSDFIKDSDGWGFSNDLKSGLRIVDPIELTNEIGKMWHAELWRLHPTEQRLWRIQAPEKILSLENVYYFEKDGKGRILLPYHGDTGYILDKQTGEILQTIDYCPSEIEQKRIACKKGLPIDSVDKDSLPSFHATTLSFLSCKGLLACGAFEDRRVRVISIDPPQKVVFEANTCDHRARPRGGVWQVDRVQFAGGKYLIADYIFAGRGTSRIICPTDIFDTETWKRVWKENTTEIESVCLSPDGKTLAFLRGLVLEIGPFVPQTDVQ